MRASIGLPCDSFIAEEPIRRARLAYAATWLPDTGVGMDLIVAPLFCFPFSS